MGITTTLIIGGSAIILYIAFLVLGFSLKDKNLKAQNLKNKEQILRIESLLLFFNLKGFAPSNKPNIIVYKPIKVPSTRIT